MPMQHSHKTFENLFRSVLTLELELDHGWHAKAGSIQGQFGLVIAHMDQE